MEKFPLIAGPCVIEDEGLTLEIAEELKHQLTGLSVDWHFKASFDKANRSSLSSFRGPGLAEGLKVLEKVKHSVGSKILTDFHAPEQADSVAAVADVLQIPAFLCRQTDIVVAGARTCQKNKRVLNVKKGQFLAPQDVANIIEKVKGACEDSPPPLWITERGISFGYQTLIVDMSGIQTMRALGVPVIYDATHSVQSPGAAGGGKISGGKRENIEVLARSAMAAGADGLFLECHPDPSKAKSDGTNAMPLEHVGAFVRQLLAVRETIGEMPLLLEESKRLFPST